MDLYTAREKIQGSGIRHVEGIEGIRDDAEVHKPALHLIPTAMHMLATSTRQELLEDLFACQALSSAFGSSRES